MARNTRRMPIRQDDIWSTLSDGRTYSSWVVGTTAFRDVDGNWPARGSRLRYRVGRGPLSHDGHTEVMSMEPGRCLELEAHAWPFGSVRIAITLHKEGDGTLVEMVEHPARGAAAMMHNPLGDALLRLRNVEALRRLERTAQR